MLRRQTMGRSGFMVKLRLYRALLPVFGCPIRLLRPGPEESSLLANGNLALGRDLDSVDLRVGNHGSKLDLDLAVRDWHDEELICSPVGCSSVGYDVVAGKLWDAVDGD